MRSEFRTQLIVAVLLNVLTTSAFAGVITIGKLADATSARVVAIALKDRSDAQHPQHSMFGPGAGPGGFLVTNPGSAAPAATIVRISPMGGRTYAVVRGENGEVEDLPVGQTGESGLTVRARQDGTYELINEQGAVITTYNPNGPQQQPAQSAGPGQARGTFLLPAMGGSQARAGASPLSAPPVAPSGIQ